MALVADEGEIILLKSYGNSNIISRSPLKHLPEFDSPEYKQLTIHHLLMHTSGLDTYTSFPEFDRSKHYTEEELVFY